MFVLFARSTQRLPLVVTQMVLFPSVTLLPLRAPGRLTPAITNVSMGTSTHLDHLSAIELTFPFRFFHTSDPTQRACDCPPPYMECAGVCGNFIGCPSGIPQLPSLPVPRRSVRGSYSDLFPRSTRSRYGVETLCPPGQQPCGSPNNGHHAWECVDIQHDLTSCGGCVVPGPFSKQVAVGKDCSAIMRADGVTCSKGRCVVESCMDGFVPSKNGSECVPKLF